VQVDYCLGVLRTTIDRVASLLRSGWVDAPRLVGRLAQPAHLRLAKEFLLPLTREEVVADHWLDLPLTGGLTVGADAGARISLELHGGDDGGDQHDAGDEKDLNHRATPFV
jgi:hypothetical protein